MSKGYVHGYSDREVRRLADQANTLAELLHYDTLYPAGSEVLESGCGTGAQTIILAPKSPKAHFVSVDISENSLAEARARVAKASISNVVFQQADIFNLSFEDASFDHVFVCFVLEHLSKPLDALKCLKRVLKKGGTIAVIEGDHGSWYCHPETREARCTVECLIEIQARLGGNSLIGRELFPLVRDAGFKNVSVSPRMVYVDSSKPALVEGFSKNTFIAMVEGVKSQAISMGLMDEASWNKGIADMYKATEPGGTFCYTFFKAVGR